MEKNDWQDQKNNNGSDFMKVVQDAINSGDYQQLNEQVRKTVSASVQEVYNMGGKLQNGIMEGMRQAGNGLQEGLKEGMNSAQREWRESANTGWKKTEVTYRTNYGKDHTPAYQAGAWKRTQQGKRCRPSMHRIRREKSQDRSCHHRILSDRCICTQYYCDRNRDSHLSRCTVNHCNRHRGRHYSGKSRNGNHWNCDPWQSEEIPPVRTADRRPGILQYQRTGR